MKRVISLYKEAYSGLSAGSWWLSAVMLINRCGTMVVPFMSLYLTQQRGYSISKAGFVVALFGVGAICGGAIGGRLADRFGFYYVQLITLAGGGCLFIVLGQMRSFPAICLLTFILSIVNESFRLANSMAIAHYSAPENRTRSYSLNRLAINLGWALGGTLGGVIATHNYSLLFWIDGVTNLMAAGLLYLFLTPAPRPAPAEALAASSTDRWAAYRDRTYLAFAAMVVLMAYAFFQLFSTLPVFFRKSWELSELQIGLTMAVNGLLIAIFEMVLVFQLDGKRTPLYYVAIGTAILAASFAVLNILPPSFAAALVSTALVTAGEMFSMPFMNSYWLSRTSPENRGQYAGLYTISWAIAQCLGPGSGAKMAEALGFRAHWWIITGILLLSAGGFWYLLHRQRRGAPLMA